MDPAWDRFWSKVSDGGDCWAWSAQISANGYGAFSYKGRGNYAHRVAYELMIAEIPEGLHIDHLCRNRWCVNPYHLEPVTKRENDRRKPPKTHCPKMHEYDEKNTYYDRVGCKRCRTCGRDSARLKYRITHGLEV
jgi:hypothetical protein